MSYTFAYLTPKKIYTPTTVHVNNLTTMPSSTNYILIPQSPKPELFFNNKIFNTYVLSEEENVYILYHINNELVFIDKSVKLNYNTIYIVEVKEETSFYKKVMIYKPTIYKGRVKKGNFLAEECYLGESDKFIEQEVKLIKKINENQNKINNTIEFEDKCFGLVSKGKIIYRNVHEENDSFYSILINKDTFLEYTCNLNYILTGKIVCVEPIKVSYHNLTITVLENLPPTFVDKSTKLFYTNQSDKYLNRSVKVRIIKERLGMLLGSFDLGVKEGEIRTAIVTRITDKLVFLEINCMKGRMLRNEERNLWVKKSVKGIVTKVENNFFEFSVLKLKEREFYDEFDKSYFELPFFEENSFGEERSLLKK